MRYYDFAKAKELIVEEEKKESLISAALYMYEDRYWTECEVWANGAFTVNLDNKPYIGGIQGSNWGMPSLVFYYQDRKEKTIRCGCDKF